MYDSLETNIPHMLMKYSDQPSFEQHQLFPSRETTIEYLDSYAEEIRPLVHFQTQVIDVRLKLDCDQDVWAVRTKSLVSNEIVQLEYDAVLVASGHFSLPALPDIKGIREWNQAYKGIVSHSKFYRNPNNYAGKKVIIVGNAASGSDIASQIGVVSKHPLLVSQRSMSQSSFDASYKENICEIAEFLPASSGQRAVRCADGRVETDIDAILFCTGYYYSLPFLESLEPKLIETGERVQNLYQHLISIDHPSLAFIGLPSKMIPFRTSEGQAAVISRIWSKRLELPSKIEMRNWEASLISEHGAGRYFHALPFPEDMKYLNFLVEWAKRAKQPGQGKIPPRWSDKETWLRERFPAIKRAFAERGEDRHHVTRVEELGFDYDTWLNEQHHQRSVL